MLLLPLVAALAFSSPAHAATNVGLERIPSPLYEEAVREEKVAVGVICKHSEDFRQLFRSPTWMNPRPDPMRALNEVRVLRHDPDACGVAMLLYTGTPERVDRIVRNPHEIYFTIRFTPLNLDNRAFNPVEPEFRYLLVPGK